MARVKWGVLGAGGIARRRTIPEGILTSKNAELTAVMDIRADVAQDVSRQFGGVRAHESARKLLRSDDVEAVYIATPADQHEALFRKAIRYGKHVLIEKPLATTVGASRRMAKLIKPGGPMATEGYMMKFHPLHQHARELVATGKLGKLVCMRGQLSCWFPRIPNNWRQDPKQGGGGSLMDMATHIFDLMQYIAGEPIVEVFSYTNSLVHSYLVEDSSLTVVRFPSGAQGIVEAYFNMRDESVPRRLEIYGSDGALLADGTIGQGGGTMREIVLPQGAGYDAAQKREGEAAAYKEVVLPERNMYQAEIEYLSDCILSGAQPNMNTIDEGVRIMEIAEAAYTSARTGKRVLLNP
jgi:predicted dehydrogenase